MDSRIGCPGENEKTNWDEPAREHHWNKAHFGRRFAVVLCRDLEVVCVDERRASCTHENADGEWNEHQASRASTPPFTLLVNDGIPEGS